MESTELIYGLAAMTLISGTLYAMWIYIRAKKADNDGKTAYFDPDTRQ